MLFLLRCFRLSFLALLILPTYAAVGQTCKTTILPTTDHLVDHYDGTISDPKTGLIWKKCSEGQSYSQSTNDCTNNTNSYNWQAALEQAQAINNGDGQNFGEIDWRVPNINELGSIVELSCFGQAISQSMFPNTPAGGYWSSSPAVDSNNYQYLSWILNFSTGYSYTYSRSYDGSGYGGAGGYVRLVR